MNIQEMVEANAHNKGVVARELLLRGYVPIPLYSGKKVPVVSRDAWMICK
jgi:hypothetical protein